MKFENYQLTFIPRTVIVQVAVICRLHLTEKNALKAGDFFREFSEFVDSLATCKGHLLILGDFSGHWDYHKDTDTECLSEILGSANLIQHVKKRNHRQGHILDLVITHESGYYETFLSSHICLIQKLSTD